MTKRIDVLFFDATSGHRSSALAIEKALIQTDPSAKVRVLNLPDVLRYQPLLQALSRIGVDVFNWGVRREQAWFLRHQIGTFQAIQSRVPAFMIKQVAQFWADNPPDVVVSVLPICNLLLQRALHQACPESRYLIIPVDFEEGKKLYWFDKRIKAHYINPTPMLAQQATAHGIAVEQHIRVKGMPVDPLFYETPVINQKAELAKLGLNPSYPTVLVGFGGQGSILLKHCAQQLFNAKQPINAIFLCGRHQSLYDELSVLHTPYPKLVLGFTPEPPAYYYNLADIMVGKPGSMTITEAIVTHTALLAVESNSLALVQRGNESWLRRVGVGEVIHTHELSTALERVLYSDAIRANIEREQHRGVFEIAEIITRVANGQDLHPQQGAIV